MPIFEYQCGDCGSRFELLVRADTRIACPDCDSGNVVKRFSPFSSHVKKTDAAVPSCHTGRCGCDLGKCGSGFCGVE
jgi:putative FmdB family regulatory protein